MQMVRPYFNLGHQVFCDRFFTSPTLFEKLWEKGTAACGTLSTNRRGSPPQVKGKFNKQVRHSSIAVEDTSSESRMTCAMWIDKKPVVVLSTGVPQVLSTVRRRIDQRGRERSEVPCPASMGFVDQADAERGKFRAGRTSRRWWLYIYWFCVNSAIGNAHHLHTLHRKASGKKPLTTFDFRRQLVINLVSRRIDLNQMKVIMVRRSEPDLGLSEMPAGAGCRIGRNEKGCRGCVACPCGQNICNTEECFREVHNYFDSSGLFRVGF